MIFKAFSDPGTHEMEAYGRIDATFEVTSIFELVPVNGGLGGINLIEKEVHAYLKDYDALPGNSPAEWPRTINLEKSTMLLALEDDQPVGGVLIIETEENVPAFTMDIHDIRLNPDFRGKGIGRKLVEMIFDIARSKPVSFVRAETQNTNTGACKFYSSMGFVLHSIDKFGYSVPEVMHEARLLWYKDIAP